MPATCVEWLLWFSPSVADDRAIKGLSLKMHMKTLHFPPAPREFSEIWSYY